VAKPQMVLVVEDEPDVREVVVRMLQLAGFESVDVANGAEALALLQGGLSPSVIVLDLWMPIMDGWEFLERAQPSAPVIVLSGIAEAVNPLPRCVVKVLTKPITPGSLESAIRSVGVGGVEPIRE
jgi:CheY-like chemotaxis protein